MKGSAVEAAPPYKTLKEYIQNALQNCARSAPALLPTAWWARASSPRPDLKATASAADPFLAGCWQKKLLEPWSLQEMLAGWLLAGWLQADGCLLLATHNA